MHAIVGIWPKFNDVFKSSENMSFTMVQFLAAFYDPNSIFVLTSVLMSEACLLPIW